MKFNENSFVLDIRDMKFHLRDGFDGTLADALREVADYLEKPTPNLITRKKMDFKSVWFEFLDVLDKGGKLNIKGAGLNQYNPVNGWQKLDNGANFN